MQLHKIMQTVEHKVFLIVPKNAGVYIQNKLSTDSVLLLPTGNIKLRAPIRLRISEEPTRKKIRKLGKSQVNRVENYNIDHLH